MSDVNLHAEIEALRREIAALRAEWDAPGKHAPAAGAADADAEPAAANVIDQLHTLVHEVAAFAEETEQGVISHPLISVAGALALGILIGRMTHR